ncbi:hypothetical protein L7F22_011533 [Adiantum nelumboides]|nr:hypothetical protein [Adiantum nelumboides]
MEKTIACKSEEQRQVLRSENKCFICEQLGHIALSSPRKKRPADSEDKEDRKGKRPMAGLVQDMVGDKPNSDASELCRAWGKVRDQTMLIFFDPHAKANFISRELASKLGIRLEEMGFTTEVGLACPGHTETVTPIIGKLRLHIQFYVDAEEFYIMPLDGCDVLLGIPWMFRVQGIMDAYNKKITVQSRGKTHILDVKIKGESIPTVSASAITSVMKKYLSAYLVFAREVSDCDESNLSVLDKERSMFLQEFSDFFFNLVPGSSPPNRPPYRFYQWFTDLESAMKSETEEKYQQYVNTLTEHMETCDQIFEQLDNTLHLFDDLQEQHRAVATKTKTLHDACERLVLEKDRLVDFADALRNKLNYFDELENIATQFYSPTMNVANGHFLPLLKRLDECISYVSNNPQYADSGVYAVKFRQLQSRALSMVRTHVLGVLKTAAQQVQAGIKESSSVHGKAALSEAAETSVLYVRFKAAANEIQPVMEEIESRKSKAEYSQILADCHSLYCEQRLTLVRGVVRQRISGYSKSEPLASLTRQGCAYLMQVKLKQPRTFEEAVEFAKNKEWKAQRLSQLGFEIEPNIEVKVVEQPRILTKEPGHDQQVADDVDTFRKEMQEVVGLMKNLSVHMMGGGRSQGYGYGRGYGSNEGFAGGRGRGMVCQSEHLLFDHFFSSSSSDTSNLAPLVDPLCTVLYDILRPKLIHEANLELLCELVEILKGEVLEEELGRRGDSVAGLKPTITRILADVQERLTFRAQTHMRDEIANYLPSAEDLDYPAKLEREASSIANVEAEEGRDAYGILYPPLEKTLSCLSKLYRSLEPAIFTGLAQDSIGVCSSSIQKASKMIMKQSQMDGQLFLIKHLLILREQIAPFDIEFGITYKELDFAHLLDHLRRIFRGQASFFDFASRSTFARAFSPRVTENQLDAKKDLERTLKSTCEQFIMSITKLAVEPMLSFITKN